MMGCGFTTACREFGIEKANHLNKAAIKSLAPIEIERIKKALGIDNMNASMSFPRKNVLHWAFEPNKCFAFKGIRRIGAIDQYECGVIYRVACWFDSLGLQYSTPSVGRCLMLTGGTCSGDFEFIFP
ncbi:MAG: hypothetical protein MZV70_28085 [Desulfobacterales bacterium]|nr:hypothetical protein [Desulfobacterales bacterium]